MSYWYPEKLSGIRTLLIRTRFLKKEKVRLREDKYTPVSLVSPPPIMKGKQDGEVSVGQYLLQAFVQQAMGCC